ncbi:Protein argonaute-1 [Trichinella spiralis]|uniref:Protein argonaute-1 n=1 Tax=Trichinella spiralis TaxID=6334 RepID=A0ABR3KE92_TRISP
MAERSKEVKSISDNLSQLRLKELVKRPDYGTVGMPIKLACNYFPLKACQTTSIIRYASTDALTRILNCVEMVKKSNFNMDEFCLRLSWNMVKEMEDV